MDDTSIVANNNARAPLRFACMLMLLTTGPRLKSLMNSARYHAEKQPEKTLQAS
jgi:hypothetical protein